MGIILRNAALLNYSPAGVVRATLRIADGKVVELIASDDSEASWLRPRIPADADETIDCSRMVVIPGLVVGHTHLYSALAVGMPPPKQDPKHFVEILEQVWWKLDRALDDEGVYISALVGAARAALCGATTLIDHHASPNAIAGSLDRVKEALDLVGIRGVLCYEVTDRNGLNGAKAGLAENDRFLAANAAGGLFAGLVGAHASFTLGDASLDGLADLADQHKVGVHIHVAEDPADAEDCLRRTGGDLVARLRKHRILRPDSIFAHCTHLPHDNISTIHDAACWMAHNTRSNMNNSVGYAPIAEMNKGNLALGTDGIDGDIFTELKAAWFKARDARADLPFGEPLKWVAGAARLASQCLKTSLGKLEVGCAADLVLLDYNQFTPLDPNNALAHWFFGVTARNVHSVMCNGKWTIRNRQFTNPAIAVALTDATDLARKVWERFKKL